MDFDLPRGDVGPSNWAPSMARVCNRFGVKRLNAPIIALHGLLDGLAPFSNLCDLANAELG